MQTPHQAETPPPEPSPFFRYRFADVDFDESLGQLRVAGVVVDIEPRPRELLSELLRRSGEVVSREELLEALWEGRPVVDNVLANAVTKLRKALGAQGAERLVNVPRVGYRLAGPIERVAVGQHTGSLPALLAGERVPGREAYVLEAPLGRGAAPSLVWRARDPKLLETRIFKFAADSERLGALKREYTLYRVLRAELGERDDFARVLGANFSAAPYFIECEDGGPDLLAWGDDGERLASLTTAERLALFLKIARAVAAAHGVGVLHKDLKPANVLVTAGADGGWSPRLTDFGSSRLLDPGRLAALGVTAMGLTVTHGVSTDSGRGTPLYLAPELMAGKSPTTQSDLYALGLMLYQIVVGDLRRLMATGWQREIEDELLVEDIAAATEGRPEDRLGSVAELVERLERLEARRAAAAESAAAAKRAEALLADVNRRRARRPWVVAAMIALATGLATSLWFYSRATHALAAAQQESARANAINEFLSKDVLQSKDVIKAGTRKTVSIYELLHSAGANIPERFKGQPLVEAAVRLQLGRTFMRMAANTDASRHFVPALALAEPLLAADDPFLLTLQLTRAENQLRMTNPGEVEAASNEIDAAIRAAGPVMLQQQTALAFQFARADCSRLRALGRPRDALMFGQRMVALADTVPEIDAETRFEARQDLAELYLVLGEQARAEALLAEATRSSAGAGNLAEVAYVRATLATIDARRQMSDLPGKIADLTALGERVATTLGRESLQFGSARDALADAYIELGDAPHAALALRESLQAFTAAVGTEHQYVKITEANLALQLVSTNHPDEAIQIVDRIEPWFAVHSGHRYLDLDVARNGALIDLKRPAEALAHLEALSAADLAIRPEQHWQLDGLRGRALVALGRRAEGMDVMKAAIEAGSKLSAGPPLAALRHELDIARNAPR